MNPQQISGLTRGMVVGIIALACSAGAYFCAHFVTSNANVQLAVAAVGIFLSSVAALLGYGSLDGRRAARVRGGDLAALHKSDVGSDLLVPPQH